MENDESKITHSKLEMASFGFASLSREYLRIAFSATAFFFYETVVQLNVWLTGLAFVLFAIYNMFNDPIVGFITNRKFKFTKKWGRRFPFILLGALPWGFSYIIIFLPPTTDPVNGAWILFFWLLFTTCLFDTFHSIFFVNFIALFPDKFRSMKERRLTSGIQIMIGVVGTALGAIVPPLFLPEGYTGITNYILQGIVTFFICTGGFLISIPGVREDQDTIDHFLEKEKEKQAQSLSFFKSLLRAVKQRPFISFMVIYALYQSLVETMQASVHYVIKYTFGREPGASTLVFAAFLIGVLISTPIWTKISHKLNDNRKMLIIASLMLAIITFPMTFLRVYELIVLNMFFWGIPLGGFWVMISPVSSDVIDNSIALTEKREESLYTGFQMFFGRLGIVAQALTFVIVHSLTGFDVDPYSELAIWGIHIHLAVVPTIFMLIGVAVFWKYYDLTPDKIVQNRDQIRRLKL